MKSKIVVASLILVAALAGMILFLHSRECRNSAAAEFTSIIEDNYDTLFSVVVRLKKYESGCTIFVADKNDVKNDNSLVEGKAYYETAPFGDADNTVVRILNDKEITDLIESAGIEKITIHKNWFVFEENHISGSWDRGNGPGICGFYYSLDGKPESVAFSDSEYELKSERKGWCIRFKDENKYYTEKVYGNFYYYEGELYP